MFVFKQNLGGSFSKTLFLHTSLVVIRRTEAEIRQKASQCTNLVPCIQNLGLYISPLEAVGLIKFRSH
jgi:hypothetical protein